MLSPSRPREKRLSGAICATLIAITTRTTAPSFNYLTHSAAFLCSPDLLPFSHSHCSVFPRSNPSQSPPPSALSQLIAFYIISTMVCAPTTTNARSSTGVRAASNMATQSQHSLSKPHSVWHSGPERSIYCRCISSPLIMFHIYYNNNNWLSPHSNSLIQLFIRSIINFNHQFPLNSMFLHVT